MRDHWMAALTGDVRGDHAHQVVLRPRQPQAVRGHKRARNVVVAFHHQHDVGEARRGTIVCFALRLLDLRLDLGLHGSWFRGPSEQARHEIGVVSSPLLLLLSHSAAAAVGYRTLSRNDSCLVLLAIFFEPASARQAAHLVCTLGACSSVC